MNPIEVAKKLVIEKYPQCEVAFAAGSFNRGEATATSDIDLVVVMSQVENAWRESFIYEGWPVEVFIHDEETLKYFFYEFDVKEAIPSLPNMVLEGPPVPFDNATSQKLKKLAADVIAAGPSKISDDEAKNLRYGISDLLDDLRAPRNQFEGQILVGKLHGMLGFFLFRSQGTWAASAKHIPRRIEKIYPDLFPVWKNAFEQGFKGEFAPVISLTEKILSENGGYLFEGYHRSAPKEWRKK